MTIREFAERAEISERLAYELIAAKAVPHRRIGAPGSRGVIRITEEDYREWSESTKVEAVDRRPASAPNAGPGANRTILNKRAYPFRKLL